jgi:hypothetical protein
MLINATEKVDRFALIAWLAKKTSISVTRNGTRRNSMQ